MTFHPYDYLDNGSVAPPPRNGTPRRVTVREANYTDGSQQDAVCLVYPCGTIYAWDWINGDFIIPSLTNASALKVRHAAIS